jgi:hypothetical protein
VRGFITERDFCRAEGEFPGIAEFYAALTDKPMTFLDLVWRYIHEGPCCCQTQVGANDRVTETSAVHT